MLHLNLPSLLSFWNIHCVTVETNDTFTGIVQIIMIRTGTVLDTDHPKNAAAVSRVLMLLLLIRL